MDAKQLKAAIKTQITQASGYLGGEINEARAKAMRDYLGEPMGNEIEGRSQVISTDVQDVIESIMPDLIQVFTASDKAVRFEPVGPEDEPNADQATDYANYIWNVDNDGFLIFHDWFKDGLLQKNGIIKIWWDDSKKIERKQYTGLSDELVTLLKGEDDTEIIEQEQGDDGLWSITLKRTVPGGRVKIANVPPEEFLISRRAKSLDDAPFMAHYTARTQSDLIDEGYDKDQIEELPTGNAAFYGEEKTQRHSDEDDAAAEEEADRSMREIDVYECYLRTDWDDDGIAELRKITVAGPQYEILKFKKGGLDNEAIADHPFAAVTPIRMPHKFFGRSEAELVQDIQYIKTSIVRQVLDNMYNINNGRAAISKKVNLDDYLDNKVGAPIRIDTDAADAGGHIFPVVTASIGNHAYPLLEYFDTVRETRTGVNRLSQGLDPDALKNTATGINQLLGRSQQRTLLIAQVYAAGVRDAFKKILRLIIEHQEQARVIRLRNEWVEIDPRSWDAEMDVTVDVGLGRGTKDQQVVTTSKVIEATMALLTLQGGIAGPFIYAHHVRNAYAKFYEAVGIKSADPFIADIDEDQAKQIAQQAAQQPNPEAQAEMAKLEFEGQKAQMQAQMDMQQSEMDGQLRAAEMQSKNDLTLSEQQLKHIRELMVLGHKKEADEAKLALDAYLGSRKLELEQFKAVTDARTKRIQAAQKSQPRAA